jgi:2-iminoacetate synthase ThiH
MLRAWTHGVCKNPELKNNSIVCDGRCESCQFYKVTAVAIDLDAEGIKEIVFNNKTIKIEGVK